MEGRISMIKNGKRQMSRAFLRSHEELNFSVGVDNNPKTLPTPIRNSSMKGFNSCLEAVARARGLENGRGYRLQHLLRWSQIGRSD
tara:strand:- start:570 stop:827 length:258 start_codon:yes stop_codon:yes gene_type:complete